MADSPVTTSDGRRVVQYLGASDVVAITAALHKAARHDSELAGTQTTLDMLTGKDEALRLVVEQLRRQETQYLALADLIDQNAHLLAIIDDE